MLQTNPCPHEARAILSSPPIAVALLLTVLGGYGCGAHHGPGAGAQQTQGTDRCLMLESPQPEITPPTSVRYPVSHLVVHGQISERWLNAQLDKRVSRTVAQEDERDLGVAGLATYRVQRGDLSLHQQQGEVWATLPLAAEISLCKPFGQSCFRYGSCSPKFDIEAHLDEELSQNYALEAPQLRSIVRRGCRIGIDVTPQIDAIVRRELAQAQKELARGWPQLPAHAQQLTRFEGATLSIEAGKCARFSDWKVAQRAVRLVKSDTTSDSSGLGLGFGLQVSARIEDTSGCATGWSDGTTAVAPTSPTTKSSLAGRTHIFIPERVDETDMERVLRAELGSKLGAHRLQELQLASEGLYVKVLMSGAHCGAVWFKVGLKSDERGDALTTWQARPVFPPSRQATGAIKELAALLDGTSIPLTGGKWLRTQLDSPSLQQHLLYVQSQLDLHDLELLVDQLETKPPKTQIASDGVYVFHEVSGHIRIGDKKPPRAI